MNKMLNNIDSILDSAISGYHQYSLTKPFHITYASNNLCQLLKLSSDKLNSDSQDLYEKFIHPDDKNKYAEFLNTMAKTEQQLTIDYRILKADGSICSVCDTMVSKANEDGAMVGFSVLSDISEIKLEQTNLRFLNDTIPCGFLRYTCESQPKVTYINDKMKEMLRFPQVKDGEMDYLELYKDNIYLMIPMEERKKFTSFLNKVYEQETPVTGDICVLRCDGTKGYFFGWVTKVTNPDDTEEFQSVCIDITDKHHLRKEKENQRYIKALSDVYDKIFELNIINNTIRYLKGTPNSLYKLIENIPMQVDEAIEKWTTNTVHEEDRQKVLSFFREYSHASLTDNETGPARINYRALSSSGKMKNYSGIFLKIDDSTRLFCCRNVAEADEISSLRTETESLKSLNEGMQELVSKFTDGIAAFEVTGDVIKPLYESENVCEYFGYSREQWQSLMDKGTILEDFVSRSGSSYESYLKLLDTGEGEFIYFDINKNLERKIKAICSQKKADGISPRYIMLYHMDEQSNSTTSKASTNISIRTFGYFDVFVDGKPIAFRTQKAKELFALLVDRRGGFVSSDEAICFLWEDEPVNTVTLARYRKVALRLKNILEEYGISEIVESVDGKRRIATEKVQCDLFDYLSGKEEFAQSFKGSYLTNYSWGETTLGELMNI